MWGNLRKLKGEIFCTWDSGAHLGRHCTLLGSIAVLPSGPGRAKVCRLGSDLEKSSSSLELYGCNSLPAGKRHSTRRGERRRATRKRVRIVTQPLP